MQFIDEIDIDLKSLIFKDFGSRARGNLSQDLLLKWFHFKARQITPRFRKVIKSAEIETLRGAYPTINLISENLSFAGDLQPWLSDKIRNKKTNFKSDLLFNEWQIHHFHLGNFYVTPQKIRRTESLLFVYIAENHAVMLDVQPHQRWANKGLLEILLRTHPIDMEKYDLKFVGKPYEPSNERELLEKRKAGITSLIDINDKMFAPPGGGISTSRHSRRIVDFNDLFHEQREAVINNLKNNNLPKNVLHTLTSNLLLPIKLGIRLEMGQIIFYEKNRNIDLMTTKPLV